MNGDSNHYKFTGKERDSETGLDYFGARYYSNGLGRFITPDWSAIPAPVPYADLSDPQSLNQYGYVRNLPTSKVDLDGHVDCPPVCVFPDPTAEDWALIEAAGQIAAKGGTAALRVAGTVVATVFYLISPGTGNGTGKPNPEVEWEVNNAKQHQNQNKDEQNKNQQQQGQTQKDDKENPAEPQTSTSGAGARKGGGDQQTAPGTKKDRTLQGTIDQKKDLDRAQKNQTKTRRPIDSTGKTDQNLKHKLDRIKTSDDVKEEH